MLWPQTQTQCCLALQVPKQSINWVSCIHLFPHLDSDFMQDTLFDVNLKISIFCYSNNKQYWNRDMLSGDHSESPITKVGVENYVIFQKSVSLSLLRIIPLHKQTRFLEGNFHVRIRIFNLGIKGIGMCWSVSVTFASLCYILCLENSSPGGLGWR